MRHGGCITMNTCLICPRKCQIDRNKEIGLCKTKSVPIIASIMVHRGEEPPISGNRGSGTVFFSGCNLNCAFCQNHDISQEVNGVATTVEELANIYGIALFMREYRPNDFNE